MPKWSIRAQRTGLNVSASAPSRWDQASPPSVKAVRTLRGSSRRRAVAPPCESVQCVYDQGRDSAPESPRSVIHEASDPMYMGPLLQLPSPSTRANLGSPAAVAGLPDRYG